MRYEKTKRVSLGLLILLEVGLTGLSDATPKKKFPAIGPLPSVPIPPDNPITPAKVKLGKLLYFDPRLSGDGSTSCNTCHTPAFGWGDGNALSRGYPGTQHWRNSQTVLNAAYYTKLFWAGESTSLESQAGAAITGNLAGVV
jgi:cytochrome c peroxidase